MDELSEKMNEARGKLSAMIFGKKTKKPRELIQTLESYLTYLQGQQAALALLSPNSQALAIQQQQQQNASSAAGANGAQPQPGHSLTISSITSPLHSSSSQQQPLHQQPPPLSIPSAAPSPAHSAVSSATGTTTIVTPPTTAGGSVAAHAHAPLLSSNSASNMHLHIPSPAHHALSISETTPVSNLTTPFSSPAAATGVNSNLSVTASTPAAASSSSGGGGFSSSQEELPHSITSELDAIVVVLYGDAAAEATNKEPDTKLAKEIIDLMFEADLFRRVLEQLRYLEFEARKFFTRIFEYALTQRRELSIPYILRRRHIILQCIHAYEEKDVSIALSCDAILRACIQCEPITEMMLQSGSLVEGCNVQSNPSSAVTNPSQGAAAASTTSPQAQAAAAAASAASADQSASDSVSPSHTLTSTALTPTSASSNSYSALLSSTGVHVGNMILPFFRYLHLPTFINSHAFATFKLLLTIYPTLSAAYLRANYEVFFRNYNALLCSANYATKVQSFAFLGELLQHRLNQEVMMRYVNDETHLKVAMVALRGPRAIQLAVFSVLKIFVPNPYKSEGIQRILGQNKRTFLAFLEEFERDAAEEDPVLQAHKLEMIAALRELPDVALPAPKKVSNASERNTSGSSSSSSAATNGLEERGGPSSTQAQEQQQHPLSSNPPPSLDSSTPSSSGHSAQATAGIISPGRNLPLSPSEEMP